jgi:hypothetical protein
MPGRWPAAGRVPAASAAAARMPSCSTTPPRHTSRATRATFAGWMGLAAGWSGRSSGTGPRRPARTPSRGPRHHPMRERPSRPHQSWPGREPATDVRRRLLTLDEIVCGVASGSMLAACEVPSLLTPRSNTLGLRGTSPSHGCRPHGSRRRRTASPVDGPLPPRAARAPGPPGVAVACWPGPRPRCGPAIRPP